MLHTDPGIPGMTQVPAPPAAKGPRRWLRWAIPVLAFLLGVGIGGASSQSDPTTSPQFLSLQSELDTAKDETSQLSDEVEHAEAQIRQAASDAEARLQQQTTSLQQRSTEIAQQEQELAARESALLLAEQEAASTGSTTSGSRASGSVTVPAPQPQPQPEASSNVSYENCTAARAAGAAPVRAGDPGYGRHLDRDGDGIGCE